MNEIRVIFSSSDRTFGYIIDTEKKEARMGLMDSAGNMVEVYQEGPYFKPEDIAQQINNIIISGIVNGSD